MDKEIFVNKAVDNQLLLDARIDANPNIIIVGFFPYLFLIFFIGTPLVVFSTVFMALTVPVLILLYFINRKYHNDVHELYYQNRDEFFKGKVSDETIE